MLANSNQFLVRKKKIGNVFYRRVAVEGSGRYIWSRSTKSLLGIYEVISNFIIYLQSLWNKQKQKKKKCT